jgi:hypothetical protein
MRVKSPPASYPRMIVSFWSAVRMWWKGSTVESGFCGSLSRIVVPVVQTYWLSSSSFSRSSGGLMVGSHHLPGVSPDAQGPQKLDLEGRHARG